MNQTASLARKVPISVEPMSRTSTVEPYAELRAVYAARQKPFGAAECIWHHVLAIELNTLNRLTAIWANLVRVQHPQRSVFQVNVAAPTA